ncbi:MAG TPA: YbaK/EbsC family protein, partial [Bacteroidales bacterium]|nr:YbaK/EbsC family protein [Bacteroidales bacterium]
HYLGFTPGSLSPFGLINHHTRHVHLFIDKKLMNYERLSFHPNTNTASLIIPREGLFRFLEHTGNTWELF